MTAVGDTARELGIQAAATQLRRWRRDPVAFVRECLKVEQPDEWQVEALRAFPKHNRLCGVACKGPGKTALEAWLGWNFLLTRPFCKVPCTSITGPNLKDGLWAELAKWQRNSDILKAAFHWGAERIVAKHHPENWFASFRQWAQDADKEQQANTLAGIHEDYLLFLIDEVSNVPDGVVAAAEAALTSGVETKLVMMGNATQTDGPLYRAVTVDAHLWFIVRITGDPDDPKRSPRINKEEAQRQIDKYGRDSYVVRVNILGQFPLRQADKLLDVSDVAAAMQRDVKPAAHNAAARVLGVDVARFGDDDASLYPRQGRAAFRSREFSGLRTDQLGEQVIEYIDKWHADAAFVDGTGVGAGVVDFCHSRGYGHVVHEVNFGARARDAERFENKRAEMYWEAAEWVKNGGALPNDPQLQRELTAPIYWFDKKGRICLESKDDIKTRLGKSPDKADAFVLTFAQPVAARPAPDTNEGVQELVGGGQSVKHDFDPFDERRA